MHALKTVIVLLLLSFVHAKPKPVRCPNEECDPSVSPTDCRIEDTTKEQVENSVETYYESVRNRKPYGKVWHEREQIFPTEYEQPHEMQIFRDKK